MGEQLYPKICGVMAAVLEKCAEKPARITAGMMTGMILDKHSEAEMRAILDDPVRIEELMKMCIQAAYDHEQRR